MTQIAAPVAPTNPYRASPDERLPPAARKQLAAMRQQLADARSLLLSNSDTRRNLADRHRELEHQRHDLDRRMLGLDRERTKPDLLAALDAEDSRLRREEATNRDQAERLGALIAERSEAANGLGLTIQACDDWLAGLSPAAVLKPVAVPEPKVVTVSALTKTRDAIAEVNADLHEVRSAPIPSSEAKARARAIVRSLTTPPDVGPLLDGELRIGWPVAQHTMAVALNGNMGLGQVESDNVIGLLAWLLPDVVMAKLEAEIDAMADDDNALDAPTRAKRITALKVRRLELERHEEALVEALGLPRRPDCDPRAVLGVDGPAPREE